MKHLLTILLAAAALAFTSCAGLTFNANITPKTAASLASIAYLESVDEAKRPEAANKLGAAAGSFQFIALAPDVSKAVVVEAMRQIDTEPRWLALAETFADIYQPKLTADAESNLRASLVDISEGIYQAIRPYQPPSK